MDRPFLRADLHVHSKHSKRPSEWVLRKIGAAESYTEPLRLYETARRRGMDLVTVTDHNTLGGSLDIAHLPGTFLSEEITTYLPDNGCKLHVLAWNLTEAQHDDITRVRDNVYELVDYLLAQAVPHALAHPMFDMNLRLTPDSFEKMLLLFRNFELNGSRDQSQNEVLRAILAGLTPDDMDYLAERHGLAPRMAEPWRKNLTSGSDDHSGLNIARSHTMVLDVSDPADVAGFLAGVEAGAARPVQVAATPATMAHNLYSIAYQFYRDRLGLARFLSRDLVLRHVDRALTLEEPAPGNGLVARWHSLVGGLRAASLRRSRPTALPHVVQKEVLDLISANPALTAGLQGGRDKPWEAERAWFEFVDRASEKVLTHFADTILRSVADGNLFDVFKALGSAGASYTLLAPYVVAYSLFTKDRRFCRTVRERFAARKGRETPSAPLLVAHFTDTFGELNGTSASLARQLDSARAHGRALTVVTCRPQAEGEAAPGLCNFAPIGSFELPDYPGLVLNYPPLLKMIDWCYRHGATHIHAATPGPVGLAGLAVARVLGLPLHATYHTDFPAYAGALTGDAAMEEGAWRYLSWFMGQCDMVDAPSAQVAAGLAARGVDRARIRVAPRGVDVALFRPERRNGFLRKGFGVADEALKLLFVGRVSREKNLPMLAGVFRELCARRGGAHLVVVGGGPYLEEMRAELTGYPATFTGPLYGEELATAYASSDVFVFPSVRDTCGTAVLEALASGLPVVVTDQGGPQDHVQPGRTGLVVPGGDPRHFLRALTTLADDPARLPAMGRAARESVRHRSLDKAFLAQWAAYAETALS
jgi:glycosyltransferase involved in cell wall biosynthesis